MSTQQSSAVVTRFPPSPTGTLHVGSYRTALFNYLFARQHGGRFILRLEDTDRERSREEYAENIEESLEWLGLQADQSYRQSARLERHRETLEQLIKDGQAYVSPEEPAQEGQRAEVIRFRNPARELSFTDQIRGEVTFNTADLGDFVIAKSLEEPLYHLAVVVDDADSEVTHIIRGEDHISNTPRQVLIQEALGFPQPYYAHIPLILASDKSKLSKRTEARAILEYRELGFLPEAVLNYMALLGWNPGTEQEIFSYEELLEQFSLERVHKGGAVFSEEKMRWVNREHLKKAGEKRAQELVGEWLKRSERIQTRNWSITDRRLKQITPVALERIEILSEIPAMADRGEFDYFFEPPQYSEPEKLTWKDTDPATAAEHLTQVSQLLKDIPEHKFDEPSIKEMIWPYAEEQGRGEVLWPTRYALSGRDRSPDPFTLAQLLGREESVNRIESAVSVLTELEKRRE